MKEVNAGYDGGMIDEVRRLSENADDGPWDAVLKSADEIFFRCGYWEISSGDRVVGYISEYEDSDNNNADLITYYRYAAPHLARKLQEARNDIAALTEAKAAALVRGRESVTEEIFTKCYPAAFRAGQDAMRQYVLALLEAEGHASCHCDMTRRSEHGIPIHEDGCISDILESLAARIQAVGVNGLMA